jgi:hypothetical protein
MIGDAIAVFAIVLAPIIILIVTMFFATKEYRP